jgi:hypothetical protein
MNANRFASLFAAAAAMFSVNAGSAQAQGIFGNYTNSYPVYTAPSTTVWPSGVTNAGYAQPCTTGNCPINRSGYTTNYAPSPCATGNCPTSPYTSGYQASACPGGNCSPQCRTICGPNGCQTICHTTNGSQCGPNGCFPSAGARSNNYAVPMTSAVPSLNLDQVPAWNSNGGFNGNTGFNPNAAGRPMGRPNYSGMNAPMNGGYFQGNVEGNILNDPMVRLN